MIFKRYPELLKEVLIRFSKNEDYLDEENYLHLGIPDFSEFLIFDHIRLLLEEKLVNAKLVPRSDGIISFAQIRSITNLGYQYIEQTNIEKNRNEEKLNKSVFVIMPFAEKYKEVYEYGIKPASEKCGYICKRADDNPYPRNIVKKIIEDLHHSDIIIADLTDFNPNVLYELGIAHSIDNKTIMICNEDKDNLPFDFRSYHVLFYKNSNEGIQNILKQKLIDLINDSANWSNSPNNPVQDFLPSQNNNNKENNVNFTTG